MTVKKIDDVFYIISLSTLEFLENRCCEMHSLVMGRNDTLPVFSKFFA
jgi:hypothetical protein